MSEKNPFSGFNFEDLLKQSSSTKKLSYDDLGEDTQERLRAERQFDNSQKVKLKIDFSKFENHVFFDSAESKFQIAKNRILSDFIYNGSTEEKQNFELSSSAYESYIFENWPRNVGHASFNASTQFISASDNNNSLLLGTSSLYVSAWVNPVIAQQDIVLQVVSGSVSAGKKYGYDLYFSSATDPYVKFSIFSGSSTVSVSAAFSTYTGSWNNVAAIYDRPADILSLWINGNKQISSSVGLNSLEWKPTFVVVGSGSQFNSTGANRYNLFSGNLKEVRIQHTASEIYHQRSFSRPIDSNNFVKLRYSFNEGVAGTASVDLNVVDWSKSNLNGLFVGYNSSCRVSGNIMLTDPGDPILYSFHSGVLAFSSSIDASASYHDKNNNNLIFNLIPEGILKEDEKQDQLLKAFSLVMARYFDQQKLLIDQFSNLRTANYTDFNESPDLFMNMALKYFGWNAIQTFDAASPLSFFFGENVLSSGSLDVSLEDVRNQFWKRTLNNVSYFFQSKGKRHSIDALFNVLGINKNNISLKEYGFVGDKSSIETIRINKEKDVYLLGIGTGSLSASFVKVPLLVTSSNNEYTVEILTQLPFVSASFSSGIKEVTGSLWQFTDPNNVTGSFTLLWKRVSLTSPSGTFILTGSDGNMFSTSFYPVFDGRMLSVAAGLSSSQRPFIEIRSVDQDVINFSASEIGTVPLTGVFTGSKYDFIIGANSGSYFTQKTHGFFGEVRYWTRQLSSSEIDDHALNFESVGLNDPLEVSNPLKFRIALNENVVATSAGRTNGLTDLSNHGFVATGSQLLASANPYKKHLLSMNYISPSVDLKWNENKIRVRNKSKLSIDEVGKDTNEVALEFNLVDALNEDITKIFINLDDFHNIIGEPVNKYRDEYVELEAYRRTYFERLHREINFTNFFKLFQWFDKKIGTVIKQLLPVRTRFIGGEFVVESHMLERPKYAYAFPIFHTPKDTREGVVASGSSIISFCGSLQQSLEGKNALKGTAASRDYFNNTKYTSNVGVNGVFISPRDTTVVLDGDTNSGYKFKTSFAAGAERNDRSYDVNNFYRHKYSGDQQDEINDPNVGLNWKNEWARREQITLEGNNFDSNGDGYHTGSFIHPKIGQNAFVINSARGAEESTHFFTGYKKNVKMIAWGLSGSVQQLTTATRLFHLTGVAGCLELSQSLFDANNVLIETGSFLSHFNQTFSTVEDRHDALLTFQVSASSNPFTVADFTVDFKDDNSIWTNYKRISRESGSIYLEKTEKGEEGWRQFFLVLDHETVRPRFSLNRTNVMFRISSSTDRTYAFKDFQVQFNEQLTNDGIRKYMDIDNTNNDKIFINLNRDILKKIE